MQKATPKKTRQKKTSDKTGTLARNTIAILYSNIPPDAPEDEQDTLIEVEAVLAALRRLDYDGVPVPVSLNLYETLDTLRVINPRAVFNLVESLDGCGRYIHIIPTILDNLKIPYTGVATEPLFLTANKITAKKILRQNNISTAPWHSCREILKNNVSVEVPCILKNVWEHASIGLDRTAVFLDRRSFTQRMDRLDRRMIEDSFVEAFIDGREFGVSLLAGQNGPQAFPPAEILFDPEYFSDRPRIVDYKAKWIEGTPEYIGTPRTFEFPDSDKPLLDNLLRLARECWNLFGLTGYARVDFRVDHDRKPWILEVNANPCISPDGGFMAAAAQAGLSYDQVIERIVADALQDPLAQCSLFPLSEKGNL